MMIYGYDVIFGIYMCKSHMYNYVNNIYNIVYSFINIDMFGGNGYQTPSPIFKIQFLICFKG